VGEHVQVVLFSEVVRTSVFHLLHTSLSADTSAFKIILYNCKGMSSEHFFAPGEIYHQCADIINSRVSYLIEFVDVILRLG
jgi:hypothetical protein